MAGTGRAPRRACFATGVAAACPVACARARLCPCACRSCRVWQRRRVGVACVRLATLAASPARVQKPQDNIGCISPTHHGDARFCIGVAFIRWKSLLRRHTLLFSSHLCGYQFIADDKLYVSTVNRRPSSCWRRRSLISTRGRSHLLKATAVRLMQFREMLNPHDRAGRTRLHPSLSSRLTPQDPN